MIYLDNAATTFPKPPAVTQAITNAMKKYGANPGRSGHKMSIESALEIYRCRNEISDFFNAEGPEYVVFTLNCTYAANMVLKGLLKPGNHVVISCLEHNAVTRPLRALEEKGITFTQAKVFPGDNDATLNSFREAINDRTALIVCTCASNVWGIRLPISRITALAHQYGVPVMVDAAQGAGVIPIDMQESQIDYLCLSGHKGLYGPMGVGVLIATHKENLLTIIEGGTGTNSVSYIQPNSMPDKFGLVICDGPPGNTIGGRYGLIPVMRTRLSKGTLILLDDASRPDEQNIAERWRQELNAIAEIAGIRKPFYKIIL